MAGDLPVIIGEQRFLQLCDEVTWGSLTGAGGWYDLPVTDYTVRFKPKRRNGQARVGSYQRRYGANVSGNPVGNLVCPLYGWGGGTGSLAQTVLEWGFLDQETIFPRSKAAQWEYTTHADDKGHLGLRVNKITVAGSASGIVCTLELMGASATNFTGSASPPTTRNKLVEFLFEDAVLTLNGTVVSISAFQWSCERNLDAVYNNSKSPVSMPKTQWTETFSCTPLKADATWDALRDNLGMPETTASLVMKGLNNVGSGAAWTVCTVAFDRLSLIDSDENGGTGVIMNPLTFDVLKLDGTTANGSVMAWTSA